MRERHLTAALGVAEIAGVLNLIEWVCDRSLVFIMISHNMLAAGVRVVLMDYAEEKLRDTCSELRPEAIPPWSTCSIQKVSLA